MQAGEGNLCVCEGRQIKSHHQVEGLQLYNIKWNWVGGRDRDRTGDLLVANERRRKPNKTQCCNHLRLTRMLSDGELGEPACYLLRLRSRAGENCKKERT